MEQRRQGRQRASECIRKQKRKELDARRSKCRIRIGGHLEQWCQLKEQLGFSLHSQLAKYLIDRYTSQGCVLSAGQGGSDPSALPTDALQHLVVLSHVHSQECSFIPNVKTPSPGDKGAPGSLVWECMAGHTFSWGPSAPEEQGCAPPGDSSQPGKAASRRKKERGASSESSPLPSPVTSRRRSLRRAALAQDSSGTMVKVEPNPLGDSGVVERMAAPSSTSSMDHGGELGAGSSDTDAAPLPTEAEAGMEGIEPESAPGLEDKSEEVPEPKEDEDEDFTEEDDLTYTDDLRDENYHPSLDSDSELKREQSQTKSCKRPMKAAQLPTETSPANGSPSEEKVVQSSRKKRGQPSDKDVAQIGPKRIRKATKREMLLCDFEGCGKIFSNRQYLNHHKKYQHVHQKTFTCSEPSCGKSFNFKKHLKEHEKLHSDKRDYICEYCARPFRTSSNLIIHRRIHTGEKPIQYAFRRCFSCLVSPSREGTNKESTNKISPLPPDLKVSSFLIGPSGQVPTRLIELINPLQVRQFSTAALCIFMTDAEIQKVNALSVVKIQIVYIMLGKKILFPKNQAGTDNTEVGLFTVPGRLINSFKSVVLQ
ncbi:zinc finger protein 692 isoform X3 [Chrysemys picta bellii]